MFERLELYLRSLQDSTVWGINLGLFIVGIFATGYICILFGIIVVGSLRRLKDIERYKWNHGKCRCGRAWVKFSIPSDLGRGYCCRDCQRYIWIQFSKTDINNEP